MKVLILDAAGKEFVKRAVKLYRSVKYYGVKEMLGKQLLDSAVDAGRLCTETHKCSGTDKRNAAVNARAAVRRTLYLVSLMVESGYYSRRRTQPVCVLGDELLATLDYYISVSDKSAKQNAVTTVICPRREVVRKVVVKEPYDPNGFNEEYRG